MEQNLGAKSKLSRIWIIEKKERESLGKSKRGKQPQENSEGKSSYFCTLKKRKRKLRD